MVLNLETAEKRIHVRGRREMCPADGYVVFHNGDLVCGRLGKGTLGDGNRDGLFHVQFSLLLLLVITPSCIACPEQ